MAVASYTTDLADLYTDNQGAWALNIFSGGGGQNAITDPETDDLIQGANCVSRNPFSSSIRGIINTIGATTVAAGDAVYFWVKADVAAALATKAAGGIQCFIGDATGVGNAWYVSGSDDLFGGWKCYVIDPTVTPSTTYGAPSATLSHFGAAWNVPAAGPTKGFPFKIDAIRHGRFVEITGGTNPDPAATFDGLATFQGDTTRQWGQFQFQNGTYLFQGGLSIGTAAAACTFDDANRAIFVANTEFVSAGFNRIEVRNAGTSVTWTSITISALGTVSRGDVEVFDGALLTINSCAFADMGTFALAGSTNATASTWRGCNTVTVTSGSTITGCTFSNSIGPATLNAQASITLDACTFISDGSNHALEYNEPGITTISLTNHTFTGYATVDGATGNEVVYINGPTGNVTINASGNTGTISVRNATAASVTVATSSTLEITGLQNPSEVRVFEAGTTTEIAGQENVTTGTFSTSVSVSAVDISILSLGFQNIRLKNQSTTADRSIPVQQIIDRQYENL